MTSHEKLASLFENRAIVDVDPRLSTLHELKIRGRN